MERGYVHHYCGNGKGKTTAALGLALRQLGIEHRVLFVSFLKGNTSSEFESLKRFELFESMSNKNTNKFLFAMNDSELIEAKKDQRVLFERMMERCQSKDCVVLDEVLDLISYEIISQNELRDCLKKYPHIEWVLTGHTSHEYIVEYADYVTDFHCVKHPYSKQVKARKGVEL